MNYRHVYHAGNFADVVKHAVLALVIERLKQKPAAFRLVDTHAGSGSYDLSSEPAQKTGEWLGGIGRLIGPGAEPIPVAPALLLKPYLGAVRGFNPPGVINRYPGSPRIARALMRAQDRLVVNELHPEDADALRTGFGRDAQVKVLTLDGWTALKAVLPPVERRGVVLVDPPFEAPRELERLVKAIGEAVKRFATGVYLLWYPIKDRAPLRRFKRDLAASGLAKVMAAELFVRSPDDAGLLNGTGLIIINPPFELDRHLAVLLPFLAKRLAVEGAGRWSIEWLAGEGK
jgi:23S rRNA (adenine2030-N6)-methyltransferase